MLFELCQDLIWLLFIQDLVMDILRVLSSPDLEVRKKTLQLALDLVSSRNVEEVSNMHSISKFFFIFYCPCMGTGIQMEYAENIIAFICFPVGYCFEEGGDQDKQRNRT